MHDTAPRSKKKLTLNQLNRGIDGIVARHVQGVQIHIMDIPKIYAAASAAYTQTHDIDQVEAAIITQVAALRRN